LICNNIKTGHAFFHFLRVIFLFAVYVLII